MTAVWRRDVRALWRRSGQRAVVLAPGRGEHLLLSDTGFALWQMLADPVDEQSLVESVAAAHGIDPDAVAGEIRPFLEELLAAGAVEQV